MLHGVERYEIDGEIYEGELMPPQGVAFTGGAPVADPVATPDALKAAPVRRFCRLFPKNANQPDFDALAKLGLAMETEKDDAPLGPDSTIAAGFTYLGQFIDHDMTFDQTELTTTGVADPSTTQNHRSPALDLDSVYGGGPAVNAALYEPDGASFKVGMCSESKDNNEAVLKETPNDLPRQADSVPIIGDRRNDENLALAQVHVAFLKFHNSFVKTLRAELPSLEPTRLFEKAREATIRHYQRIVLHEFLPRIIDPNALEFVLSSGHRFFDPAKHDHMPIEFSAAAFRLGHSMIRPVYEWNRVFHSKPGALAPATLELLFKFTHFSGKGQPFDGRSKRLPSNWPVDWRLMFDVAGKKPPTGFSVNRARPIDTQMAALLQDLPEFHALKGVAPDALLSLAARNLLRGRLVELPDGLTVAREVAARGLPHLPLTRDQLKGGPHGHILEEEGLLEAPPLWYYILREAELQMERLPNGKIQGGARLGPVGSAIVAETIVAHIRKADVSILADGTIQHLHQVPAYTMSDLLLRVNDLNPVG